MLKEQKYLKKMARGNLFEMTLVDPTASSQT